MKNGKVFNQVFRTYATELWSKPEAEFLEWLNKDAVPAIPIPENATNLDIAKRIYGKEVAVDLYNDLTMGRKWWNSPYKRSDKE